MSAGLPRARSKVASGGLAVTPGSSNTLSPQLRPAGTPIELETLDRICHETRRPLGVIHAHVELLSDELPGPLSVGQRESLGVVTAQLELLGRLVDDVYATFEALAGKTRVVAAPLDLRALVEGLLDEYEARGAKGGPKWTRDVSPAVGILDAGVVASALRAVLENALQYGRGGGEISVRLLCREPWAEITVVDYGPGIAEEERERVFESFHRGRLGQAVSVKGLGLGLTRCRALLRVIGGNVRVSDRPEGGTGIVLEFPLRTEPPREPVDRSRTNG